MKVRGDVWDELEHWAADARGVLVAGTRRGPLGRLGIGGGEGKVVGRVGVRSRHEGWFHWAQGQLEVFSLRVRHVSNASGVLTR